MRPHEFPRRILLCVCGTSPQIITETLYALAVETNGRPPFVPTEIRVLTTSRGAEQSRLSLLAEDRAMFQRLCNEYGLEGIHFNASCIEEFTRLDGSRLEDILTPEDNRVAADHITRCVADLTADPDAAIHASIAGGRKTMGFYLGYAMSLFGREQDRVSHVLVSEGFTEHRDFFYKPCRPTTLKNANGLEMSTSDARIFLAEIPIVRLRSSEFAAVSERRLGFAEAVERANRLAGQVELNVRIDRTDGRESGKGVVHLGDEPLKLPQSQALLLHWLALRRISGARNGDDGWVERNAFEHARGQKGNLGYLDEIYALARHYGELSEALSKLSDSLDCKDNEAGIQREPLKWLEPLISDINKNIRKAFGEVGRDRYGIIADGPRGKKRYRLALAPERIRIED
jgi:CRISPR-associated protein (TIGR02584 family)